MGLINDAIIPAVQLSDDMRIFTFTPPLAASSTKYTTLIICPVDEGWSIESATAIWTTAAGTSGTLDLVKVIDGTALSSGASILTATVNLAGTAATVNNFALDPTKNFVPTGYSLGLKIVHGGTVSEGLQIQIRCRPIKLDTNFKG